jgi:hypothetical protein
VSSFTAFESACPSLSHYEIRVPEFENVYGILDERNEGRIIVPQYLGRTDTLFFRYLSTPLSASHS